jgi:hypothetical protein
MVMIFCAAEVAAVGIGDAAGWWRGRRHFSGLVQEELASIRRVKSVSQNLRSGRLVRLVDVYQLERIDGV